MQIAWMHCNGCRNVWLKVNVRIPHVSTTILYSAKFIKSTRLFLFVFTQLQISTIYHNVHFIFGWIRTWKCQGYSNSSIREMNNTFIFFLTFIHMFWYVIALMHWCGTCDAHNVTMKRSSPISLIGNISLHLEWMTLLTSEGGSVNQPYTWAHIFNDK